MEEVLGRAFVGLMAGDEAVLFSRMRFGRD